MTRNQREREQRKKEKKEKKEKREEKKEGKKKVRWHVRSQRGAGGGGKAATLGADSAVRPGVVHRAGDLRRACMGVGGWG